MQNCLASKNDLFREANFDTAPFPDARTLSSCVLLLLISTIVHSFFLFFIRYRLLHLLVFWLVFSSAFFVLFFIILITHSFIVLTFLLFSDLYIALKVLSVLSNNQSALLSFLPFVIFLFCRRRTTAQVFQLSHYSIVRQEVIASLKASFSLEMRRRCRVEQFLSPEKHQKQLQRRSLYLQKFSVLVWMPDNNNTFSTLVLIHALLHCFDI